MVTVVWIKYVSAKLDIQLSYVGWDMSIEKAVGTSEINELSVY